VVARVCATDAQCGIGKDCLDGLCRYQCDGAEDCPRGQTCQSGLCRDVAPASTACTADSECADGRCINGRCWDNCSGHADCGPQLMCDHGTCQPDWRPGPDCNNQSMQCPANASCVDGYCTVPCNEDDACRSGTCSFGYCTR
jgi:hypothetical protein